MSNQSVPADVMRELVDALKASTEANREMARLARRQEPGAGGGGSAGVTPGQVAGAAGLGAGAAFGLARAVGPATPLGESATIGGSAAAGVAGGALLGARLGPYGAAAGMVLGSAYGTFKGLAAVGETREGLQETEAKIADPSLDQVTREIAQRRVDLVREGEYSDSAKARRAVSGEIGPDAQLEREAIERAPQARAVARLAEENAQLGRWNYQMDEAMVSKRLDEYERQEQGSQAARVLVNKVAASKWSDRAGVAD